MTEISRELAINRQTLYRWISGRQAGLGTAPRAPQGPHDLRSLPFLLSGTDFG